MSETNTCPRCGLSQVAHVLAAISCPPSQAWDDPAGRIRELEAELHGLREGVEALCDPGSDGPRPYAVAIDGCVLLAVDVDHLRAVLDRGPR